MIDKETFLQTILNGMDPTLFFTYYLIAMLGVFVKFLVDVSRAIQTSKDTPDKFSWRHFFSASAVIRWVVNMLLLPLIITQTTALFGQDLDIKFALFIGIGIDGITTIIIGSGQVISKKMK